MDSSAEKAAGADAAASGKAVSARRGFIYLGKKVYIGLAGMGEPEFLCPGRRQGNVVHEKRQRRKTAGGVYPGTIPGHAERRDSAASPRMGG